ncbi:MAG TPA: AbrB/MazE/SpoVT family DNA-binding domain-containing protein [Solirubrobacteraceae bacterium]|jgi:antitoxin PrlF|nr:AbrB/MazE/SpoVT family DNA-binding domain-containing protein [Solirubrobacteraceae bacterium]
MRVTQKGQVTIPLAVRQALGIRTGSDVQFELDERGARLLVDHDRAAEEIARIRGAGEGEMSTEEILALTRR